MQMYDARDVVAHLSTPAWPEPCALTHVQPGQTLMPQPSTPRACVARPLGLSLLPPVPVWQSCWGSHLSPSPPLPCLAPVRCAFGAGDTPGQAAGPPPQDAAGPVVASTV